MSPSESQLRASLRADEGAGIDADELIRHARLVRRERRRMMAAVGGTVAAVLAVGGVVAAVQVGRGSHGTPPGRSPFSAPAACPQRPPTIASPPAASAGGRLFPDDVTALRVCLYMAERPSASRVLDGNVARSYAQRFNALPPVDRTVPCPLFLTQQTIVMLPVTANGPAPAVVGKVGGCGQTTNGSAQRNAGQLLGELAAAGVGSPSAGPASSPPSNSGRNTPGPGPS